MIYIYILATEHKIGYVCPTWLWFCGLDRAIDRRMNAIPYSFNFNLKYILANQ